LTSGVSSIVNGSIVNESMNELWNQIASRADRTLSEQQHAALGQYLDLLSAANEKMNLTRIVDRESAERLHIADALTLLAHLPKDPHRLVDVGSGGGVPGIPLAIVRPDVNVLLVESTQKKAAFLRETAEALKLSNVAVSEWRAEDVGLSNNRERFDVCTARAVGAMDMLVEWCLPLVKVGGKLLAMKGAKVTEELPVAGKAIKLVGGGKPVVYPAELPGAEHHVIVEVPKITRTDKKYPRAASVAKGKPLK
jgi:16S rRNA (guanine527-N7)-methyltransferase